MNEALLEKGLEIISQCKSRTGDIWEAHIGAAAIAGFFLARDHAESPEAARRIAAQAEAMAALQASGFSEDASGEKTDFAIASGLILEALDASIDGLHWVGHHVIYSSASLLALRELGSWGSRADIEGIVDLIRSFKNTPPGRSWLGYSASEVKKLEIEAEDRIPEIAGADQLSAFVIGELASFVAIYRAEAHHDLIGHLLTFSHALNVLDDLGHPDMFRRGLPALLKLAKALRRSRDLDPERPLSLRSPVDRLPLVRAPRSERLPAEAEYWDRDYSAEHWDFGHAFKFPFSFYDHLRRVSHPPAAAVENFRYIILSE
ncbi:hypothetical protein [Cohnella zeiphila]|nr:hypothetical protein [Cohnella zeiphila]